MITPCEVISKLEKIDFFVAKSFVTLYKLFKTARSAFFIGIGFEISYPGEETSAIVNHRRIVSASPEEHLELYLRFFL